MIKMRYVFLALPMLLLLVACNSEAASRCSVPPEDFSESDLVGTWGGDIEKVRTLSAMQPTGMTAVKKTG